MSLLFLPIDLDFSKLDLLKLENIKSPNNPYWDTININNDEVKGKCSYILEQLPFTKITALTYKIQKQAVAGHVDVHPPHVQLKSGYETNNTGMIFEEGEYDNILNNEPAGYRIILAGRTDTLEVFDGKKWVAARLPSVPGCYLLHSTNGKHQTKEDAGRELIYVRGFIDSVKHQELIKRSYKKYKNYAVTVL